MDYLFNPSTSLPPVDTELVIQVEGKAVRAKRTKYVQKKDDILEYVSADGRRFYGRFPWTYP